MNVLILGDGTDELAWARAIAEHRDFTLWAAYPGFAELPGLPTTATDLEDALAISGVDIVIVGGEPEFRAEALRRAAGEGLPMICLHPPGINADPYYQVALSDAETGAIVIPDLPLRLHPGFLNLKNALTSNELGTFRELRHEIATNDHDGGNLVLDLFPTAVDPVRALLGEIDSVTATGDPIEGPPTQSLVVQLRASQANRAEVRIMAGAEESARLILSGSEGSLTLEYDPSFAKNATLIRSGGSSRTQVDFESFNPYDAILAILVEAIESSVKAPSPNLIDGTRAMELAEAAARSLKRHRTIDLHYEEVSEEGNFKSVMTSVGCLGLWGVLLALPLALVGPAFGAPWTIYIAWAIPPVLLMFIALQSLKLAIKPKAANGQVTESKPSISPPEMLDVES